MLGIGSIWHWVIVLLVVLLVFGTKKVANAGKDMGEAVRGFRSGFKEMKGAADDIRREE